MTLDQFAETIVSKLNVPGIEPWSHHFQSTELDYLRSLSASFQKSGLRVVNIPVDEPIHLCSALAGERDAGLGVCRKWVDAAVILGAPGIRVHLPRGNRPDDIECATEMLKEVASYGASKNVVVNIENDARERESISRA